MTATLYYFAYGSNLHPVRLGLRIPSCVFVGVAELSAHQLCFHKRGQDESAKCNAFFSGDPAHRVLGAVYAISAGEKPILDEIEGEGYRVEFTRVTMAAKSLQAFLYVGEESYLDNSLQPFHWYKSLVTMGARHQGFPAAYVETINAVPSTEDESGERRDRNNRVLAMMRSCQQDGPH